MRRSARCPRPAHRRRAPGRAARRTSRSPRPRRCTGVRRSGHSRCRAPRIASASNWLTGGRPSSSLQSSFPLPRPIRPLPRQPLHGHRRRRSSSPSCSSRSPAPPAHRHSPSPGLRAALLAGRAKKPRVPIPPPAWSRSRRASASASNPRFRPDSASDAISTARSTTVSVSTSSRLDVERRVFSAPRAIQRSSAGTVTPSALAARVFGTLGPMSAIRRRVSLASCVRASGSDTREATGRNSTASASARSMSMWRPIA
jgi:hypothetical protein